MGQHDTRTDMGVDPAPVEWALVLEDWVTIWQSEMAGLVVDREMQDALLRAGELWAVQARGAAGLLAPMLQATDERARGRAGADAAPGAAAADAAPHGQGAVIRGLLERVAELERRLGASLPTPGAGERI